jgi:neutral ceramidase
MAGAASVPITAPLGVAMVGYLRRSSGATGYGQPLEATALVLDDGATRLALVSLDVVATAGAFGRRVREAIARAAGTEPHCVLVNSSHTHAAPPMPGMQKLGGTVREWTEEELNFGESVVHLAASVAELAASRLQPARVAAARTTVQLGVNRRQRVEGGTILGWNPDGVCDRDVAVLRIDAVDGRPITTVVAYACHPVVVGPEVPELSSDFVGPLRARVRAWTGGDCQFLQGCAGNIIPLEAFFDHSGPEEDFGDRLALAALHARNLAETVPTEPREAPYASAVPIAIWRREPTGEERDTTLVAAKANVNAPLQEPPTLDEIRALRTELEDRVARLKAEGAPPEAWNPPDIHIGWAKSVEKRILDGTVEREMPALVQALRIGEVGIAALPCELFCELGIAIKQRSSAPFPIALGYSNDLIGYVPTAEEFQYGGYEPTLSQRHMGTPAPYDPHAGEVLVDHAVALIAQLFEGGS